MKARVAARKEGEIGRVRVQRFLSCGHSGQFSTSCTPHGTPPLHGWGHLCSYCLRCAKTSSPSLSREPDMVIWSGLTVKVCRPAPPKLRMSDERAGVSSSGVEGDTHRHKVVTTWVRWPPSLHQISRLRPRNSKQRCRSRGAMGCLIATRARLAMKSQIGMRQMVYTCQG